MPLIPTIKCIFNSMSVMKNIRRLLAFAVVLLSAAACHTNEIDNPDNNQNPEKPQSSEVKLMAKIPQTRVTYTSTGSRLDQAWQEGDIVFGFYEEDSRVILRVGEPDEDGTAPLSPVSGYEGFITELVSHATDADHLPVALVYTGSTSTDESRLYNDNTITVSKNNQSSGQLPACMHANGYAVITDSESKTFVFDFDNDCAIFEIIGITGAEALSFGNKDKLALDYINVTNVINSIEYSYSDGDITFAPNTDLNGIFILPSGIYVDMYGNVVDSNGNNTSIMMAVVPNGEQDFIIKIDFENREHLELPYHGNLAAGKCYVFSQKAIVAAVGNEVFETVTAAFAKAKANYLAEDPNTTVVLVRDCGLAGVTKQQDGTYTSKVGGSSPLLINGYDVTLDLNGHVLTLAGGELFVVNGVYDEIKRDYVQDPQTLNTFIITDSKEKNADDEYDGKIMSSSGNYIVRNLGKFNIKGGTLHHEEDWSVVKNYGSGQLTITEGDFYSKEYYTIVNDGVVTISNGNFSGGKFYDDGWEAVILNSGTLTVNGGTFSSEDVYTISNDGAGTLIIDGGEISSTNKSALYTVGTVNISGGEISSANNFAVYALGGTVNISQGNKEPCEISSTASVAGVILFNNTEGTISGGTIKNSKAKSTVSVTGASTLVVDGGKIICTGSGSAIECLGDGQGNDPTLTVKWPSEPENTVFDRPDNVNEPLLYSASTAPVFENSSYSNSCGIVYIEGGFLYDASDSAFYKADNNYHSLKSTSGYFFYSNTAEISNETAVKADNTSLVSKDSDESITIKYTDHGISGLGDLKFTQKIEIVENQD